MIYCSMGYNKYNNIVNKITILYETVLFVDFCSKKFLA